MNDLANLLRVGWAFYPANATKNIKYYTDMVLTCHSADGAIREAVECSINYNL